MISIRTDGCADSVGCIMIALTTLSEMQSRLDKVKLQGQGEALFDDVENSQYLVSTRAIRITVHLIRATN